MNSPTIMLRDAIAAIESSLYLYPKQSAIAITEWNPPHLHNSFIVTYVLKKKSMQGIPHDDPSLVGIEPDSDFFLICEPRADKSLVKRAKEENIALEWSVREAAVRCSWEKIQWNHEYNMREGIDPLMALFDPRDIYHCASGLSCFSFKQIKDHQMGGEAFYWDKQKKFFLARWGSENLAKWRCKRCAEAETVAATARGCDNLEKIIDFLQRLKRLGDWRIGNTEPDEN